MSQTDARMAISFNRRGFFKVGLLGAGAMLLSTLPMRTAVAGKTEALLLSCMDYRLVDETERYMSSRDMKDKYDHIVLAGASLGAITDQYPEWNKTFWGHLEVAIQLHHIEKVFILDHRDCGAYKVILKEDLAGDPGRETAVHAEQLKKLSGMIREKYPQLTVELLLMSLDGQVEAIPS